MKQRAILLHIKRREIMNGMKKTPAVPDCIHLVANVTKCVMLINKSDLSGKSSNIKVKERNRNKKANC